MSHRDIRTFYKAYLTVLELLADRGLRVKESVISYSDFQLNPPKAFQVEVDPELSEPDGRSKADSIRQFRTGNLKFIMFLYDEFTPASKIGFIEKVYTPIYAKYGRELLGTTEASYDNAKHLSSMKELGNVLVLYSNPSKNNPQEYVEYLKDDIEFESFEFHEIHHTVFNPTRHAYQPKFTLLNNEERDKVRSKYGQVNLQIINRNDRINRWYGGLVHNSSRPSDIYLIRRRNGQVSYRLVLN